MKYIHGSPAPKVSKFNMGDLSTHFARRVHDVQSILIVYVPEDGVDTARKALDTASTKFPMRSRITVEEIPVEEQAQVPIQAPDPPDEVEPTEAAEEVTPIVTVGA